jgi:hypothetical protein
MSGAWGDDGRDGLDDEPEDDCWHEEYEVDILTGFATCAMCGHKWMQTAEEIAREIEAERAYDEMCREWEKERRSFNYRFRTLIDRATSMLRRKSALTDDEIPF